MGQLEYPKMLLLPYRLEPGLGDHTVMPGGKDEKFTQV